MQRKIENIPEGFNPLLEPLDCNGKKIGRIAWSTTGQYLAAPLQGGLIKVWDFSQDVEEKKSKTYILQCHKSRVTCLSWHGNILASGSMDKTISVRSGLSQHHCSLLKGHEDNVTCVALFPYKEKILVVSGSKDKTMRIWDVTSNSQVCRSLDHEGNVDDIKWLRNFPWLISADSKGFIRLWQNYGGFLNAGWEPDRKIPTIPTDTPFLCMAISTYQKSPILAIGDYEGNVKLWDLNEPDEPITTFRAHNKLITSIDFSADGQFLLTKSHDFTVRLWRHRSFLKWKPVAELFEPSSSFKIVGIAFHPDKSHILATLGKRDTMVRIWQLDTAYLSSNKIDIDFKIDQRFETIKSEAKESLDAVDFQNWAGANRALLAFVVTDIVASRKLKFNLGDDEALILQKKHFDKAQSLIDTYEGYFANDTGDGMLVAFRSASSALDFTLSLFSNTGDKRIKIRAVIDAGEINTSDNKAKGITVDKIFSYLQKLKDTKIYVSDYVKKQIDYRKSENYSLLKWLPEELYIEHFEEKLTVWSTEPSS